MSFLNRSAAAIVGALAVVAMASTAWAGQVNFRGVINLDQSTSTLNETVSSTIADTTVSTIAHTTTDTLSQTVVSTLSKTVDAIGISGGIGNTVTSTTSSTNVATIAETLNQTLNETVVSTIADTLKTTVTDGVFFSSQPADVSVEINMGTVNSNSPFSNSIVDAGSIDNVVDVELTSGITQVNAASGQANVQVSSNSVVDGDILVALGTELGLVGSSVGLKEFAHAVVCPGCAVQNSNIAFIEQIAGVALAAAETTASAGAVDEANDTLTGLQTTMANNIVSAIAINQDSVNEFSPHDNTIGGTAVPILNDVVVLDTTGITQVNAASGQSNVQNSYNNVIYSAGSFGGPEPF